MLRLENIAAEEVYSNIGMKKDIRELIEGSELDSVQDVIELINNYPDLSWGIFQRKISNIKSYMDKVNEEGKIPQIYLTNGYSDSSLLYTDKFNTGKNLILNNPTTQYQSQFLSLERLDVSEIKKYLSHTTSTGKNYLLVKARNVGEGRLPKVLSALEMYEEQIERQALLTPQRDINLFTYNQAEKKEIVQDNLINIVDYLISNVEDELVWGKITDAQKELLLSALLNNKRIDCTIKERLITVISNYTTLPELEEVAKGKQKVLNRFIVK